ncbi:MAG: prolipoprotein diacylglyceryl transferase [Candidatus Doudnabacteria bacterium]
MIPYFVFDHFKSGPFTFYPWGFLMGLGFLAGWLLAISEAKKKKMNPEEITDLSLWIVLGSILGARLLFALEHYSFFVNDWWGSFKIWEGGMSYYGGLGGGILASLLYTWRKKVSCKEIGDILVLSLALGLAIGRLGCFLVNDHLGAPTILPWGIQYEDGIARHPVALYLSLSELLIFFFLLIIRKRIHVAGLLASLYLLLHSVSRFFLDFTRSREENLPFTDHYYWGLNLAQFISIALFFISCYFIIQIKRQSRKGS